MLTNIENRLEELFEQIELLPPDKVEAAEKVMNSNIFFAREVVVIRHFVENHRFLL